MAYRPRYLKLTKLQRVSKPYMVIEMKKPNGRPKVWLDGERLERINQLEYRYKSPHSNQLSVKHFDGKGGRPNLLVNGFDNRQEELTPENHIAHCQFDSFRLMEIAEMSRMWREGGVLRA